MKNRRNNIVHTLAIAVLGVFLMAITPWGALHHHEVAESNLEKNCGHKFHVKTLKETCLICAAHFEKNYTTAKTTYTVYLVSKLITKSHLAQGHSFTALIATSLRGPPAHS